MQHSEELGPVPTKLEFDVASLEKYLKVRFPNYFKVSTGSPQITVKFFKHGQSNPTYLLVFGSGDTCVLRKQPPGSHLNKAHKVDREYHVISALHRVGFPVPHPLLLCNDASVIGTTFYLMEYVKGRVFHDVTLSDLSPWERSAVYQSMLDTLVQLHSIPVQSLGLAGFSTSDYCQRQVKVWSGNYTAACGRSQLSA